MNKTYKARIKEVKPLSNFVDDFLNDIDKNERETSNKPSKRGLKE